VPEYHRDTLYSRIRTRFFNPHKSRHFKEIFARFAEQPGTIIAVGGGPTREHPRFLNVNIEHMPGVDVVADAHDLRPVYADQSVDAVYTENTLEHLIAPDVAVREMYRVLKPGGRLLSVVPFLQGYHGYPDHFQNYTVSGHRQLYIAAGFEVMDSGGCQGPIMALSMLNARFFLDHFPPVLNVIVGRGVHAIGFCLRPLDHLIERQPNFAHLASSTFVLARRPLP
jgi:SAM-dependent methyltransferase